MFDELSDITLIETPLMDSAGFLELLLRFCFNLLVVSCIIHLFYYPKSKRRDYYFTFTLISISIFLMIFLLCQTENRFCARFICHFRYHSLSDRVNARA